MDKELIIQTILIIVIVGSSFGTGYLYEDTRNNVELMYDNIKTNIGMDKPDIYPEKQIIINKCKNLTEISDFSYCLKDSVKTFYIYNLTYDSTILTFKELKQRGGDCKDWSELYQELAIESGYNAELRSYDGILNVGYGHQWVIIYDNTKNCKIDFLKVFCSENIPTVIN